MSRFFRRSNQAGHYSSGRKRRLSRTCSASLACGNDDDDCKVSSAARIVAARKKEAKMDSSKAKMAHAMIEAAEIRAQPGLKLQDTNLAHGKL